MAAQDSGKLAHVTDELVHWFLDQALEGVGPLQSASALAGNYRRRPYASDAERVQALIKRAVAKNAGTGFVAGLGGAITLPVAIPGSLAASLAIQATMVAAIAEIYGHAATDDQVQTDILLCMIANAACEPVAKVGVALGEKAALEGLNEDTRAGPDRSQQTGRLQADDQVRREGRCEPGEARTARRRGSRGNVRRHSLLPGRSGG